MSACVSAWPRPRLLGLVPDPGLFPRSHRSGDLILQPVCAAMPVQVCIMGKNVTIHRKKCLYWRRDIITWPHPNTAVQSRANGVPSFSCSQVFHTWEAAHPPRSAPDPWPWHHVCGVTCRFQVGQPLHRGCADAWLGFTSRTLIRPRSIRGNSRSRHRGAMMFLDRFQSPVRTCSWTRGVPGFTSGQQRHETVAL